MNKRETGLPIKVKRQIDSLPSIETKDSTNYGYSVLFCPYLFYVS